MANRRLNQFRLSYEQPLVEIFARVAIGSTGAPTLTRGQGITSIVRNNTGLYTITLQDAFVQLVGVDVTQLSASALTAPLQQIVSQDVSSAKTVVVQFRNAADAATDPASGSILFIRLTLRNSSI